MPFGSIVGYDDNNSPPCNKYPARGNVVSSVYSLYFFVGLRGYMEFFKFCEALYTPTVPIISRWLHLRFLGDRRQLGPQRNRLLRQ